MSEFVEGEATNLFTDDGELNPEATTVVEIESDDAAGEQTSEKEEQQQEQSKQTVETDFDIKIKDDTPPQDRNKTPSAPPEELTEEELAALSEKANSRYKHLTKGYHDERRAREKAERELAAAVEYARTLKQQSTQAQGSAAQSRKALLEQAKEAANAKVAAAQKEFEEAYEAGESKAVVKAQTELNNAQINLARLNAVRLPKEEAQPKEEPRQEPATPKVDPKAKAWADKNDWWGTDSEMTTVALGYHQRLVHEGVDTSSDEYYSKLDARMRQVFPDHFDDGGQKADDDKQKRNQNKKPKQTVGGPSRGVVKKKQVELTKSQVAIANKLNVPLEEYARQVEILERTGNNG